MPTEFRVEGAQALEVLAQRLKTVSEGKVLRKSLTKRLGAAVKPIIPEIRAAAKAIPSGGSGGSAARARAGQTKRSTGSLRDAIARSVQQKTSLSGRSVGVRLRVDGSKMPAGQEALPSYMEGIKPWRHPVFNDPDTWVGQASHPYFFKTITPHLERVQAEVVQVMNDVAEAAGFGRG